MTLPVALLGVTSLWILYAWMASCIAGSYLSGRKGFGERIGLASGMLLGPIGVLIWLFFPPKPSSDWKVKGMFGKGRPSQDPVKMGDRLGQSPDSSAS
jgi:hypothetical protein